MKSVAKKRCGPKKWLPTSEDLIRIEKLTRLGLTKIDVAHALGISHETLFQRQKEIPEISEAFKNGKIKDLEEFGETFRQASISAMQLEKPNFTGAIFYLKARHGWNDRSGETHIHNDNRQIQIKGREQAALLIQKLLGGTHEKIQPTPTHKLPGETESRPTNRNEGSD